ncbi:MAG: bifunctional isocitrate dehydrogenase kinase/phosphatase [Labilithrix sp.]|nr:bifunctional isocitrate dehydrogenase kinase/phosphatase [Labilithrix sp.]MCW5813043.1 bifunctional isocitrate dehydrogenase kinase/phosphatase [Labilithrix sp.]
MPDAVSIARTILDGFDRHYRLFRATSARAKERWERQDWAEVREASRTRIDMYDQRVREGVDAIHVALEGAVIEEALWPAIKRAYIGLLHDHYQPECAETFFNSVARRILDRRYYRNDYIFSRPATSTEHLEGTEPTYRCYYPHDTDLKETLKQALLDFQLTTPFADLDRDLAYVQRAVADHFPKGFERRPNFQIQMLRSLFFRNKAAFAIGRVVNGGVITPFIIPIRHDDDGKAELDAFLLDEKNIGRIFSLGRSYFFVDMEVPSAYVEFLQTVAPAKSKAELFTMVGLGKQGKTLFFRDLQHHLRHSTDTFVLAEGTKGMVMVVFTLPSYPYVFKIIRDWFVPPKDTDRKSVEERYKFVKLADRVGRMSDTLEYTHVAFPFDRMDPSLVAELEELAPSLLERDGDKLVIRHLYVERRLVPLDVYLKDPKNQDPRKQRAAIDEYGRALKELAAADIFPGDLLLKNFGLTRFGRIVFYDYDELVTMSECRFRTLPKARDHDDEMSSEPWFNVEKGDVFPEQFPTFLFPPGPQRDTFTELHPDLARADFWREQQERLRAGIQEDLFAYSEAMRFTNRYG